ncbi:PTS sugar transporter subunit IIA [Lacrimispora sphenoides]|uniref:PTS system, fructose-specific IIA component/PTS system, fructose-specific IIC component n=1 Tax=Lacrimispora sphenoides JCM 1415 TaxID=1297793 RepID=A0ABY1C5F0_9FIRM|nr:PTS sugar transporter subunit IIA [Lacrimispora sphenoides]SET69706.1 PTS system, fructose-specific IIA component/PTS system, fructose-specific IIC component [[Clostridium] sphenoides JCM 1415]SUY50560.1 PTS system transporter subunit IIA [Lacrimispora sphenoides]
MMTKEVIKKEYIFTGMEFGSKDEALRSIAEQAVSLGLCRDVEGTYQGFLERESQGPTGMEDGFAIPHTRCESVIQTGIIVMKSKNELEWESFDEKPVHIMIALIVPKENYGNEHIQILASLSRMLMKQEFRNRIMESDSAGEIYEIIHQAVSVN